MESVDERAFSCGFEGFELVIRKQHMGKRCWLQLQAPLGYCVLDAL